MENKKLALIDNNNTENDKEDILTTFRKIVASAQFINKSMAQQQPQINYFDNFKANQIGEVQKNNNYNFRQCREKRKFTSEVSDFLVEEVLKRKTLLVENNTSRDLTFSEKKRNAWNEVRSLLSTHFLGFDQNIEAIKSHWRYRKRKVTDAYGEFNCAPNLENKLKEKFSPIDKQIFEELKDSNMLQQSMEIDNKSISETSDETAPTFTENNSSMSASSSFVVSQNLNSPDKKQNIQNNSSSINCPTTNNIQFILTQLIAKKYAQQQQGINNKNEEVNYLFGDNKADIKENHYNSPTIEEKDLLVDNLQKMRGKKRIMQIKSDDDLIEVKEEINKESEESLESLQRKALQAQILAFEEFRNSSQIVYNTAIELQKLLPQLSAFLNKSLND